MTTIEGCSSDATSTAATTAIAAAPSNAAAADRRRRLKGLDAFLSKHTSEDNASFGVIFAKDQAERKRAHWWAHDPEGGGAPALKNYAPSSQMITGAAAGALMPPPPPPGLPAPKIREPKPLDTLLDTLATDRPKQVSGKAAASTALALVDSSAAAPAPASTTAAAADGAIGGVLIGGVLAAVNPSNAVVEAGEAATASSSSTAMVASTGGDELAKNYVDGPQVQSKYHEQGSLVRDERPTTQIFAPFTHRNALMFPPKSR